MKKSELKQIIKEEAKKILTEVQGKVTIDKNQYTVFSYNNSGGTCLGLIPHSTTLDFVDSLEEPFEYQKKILLPYIEKKTSIKFNIDFNYSGVGFGFTVDKYELTKKVK